MLSCISVGECSRIPEAVQIFQTSHLAEAIPDFSLEKVAIFTLFKDLEYPSWCQLPGTDILKAPATLRRKESTCNKVNELPAVAMSSCPSSPDGPSDSVFPRVAEQSSSTSANSPILSQREQSFFKLERHGPSTAQKTKAIRKMRVRIATPPLNPPPQRY